MGMMVYTFARVGAVIKMRVEEIVPMGTVLIFSTISQGAMSRHA